MNPRPRHDTVSRLALAAASFLVLVGLVAAALAGFGHRWNWWEFTTGFAVLRWAAYATVAGVAFAAVAVVGAVLARQRRLALAALPAIMLGAVMLSVPLVLKLRVMDVPPINDISTDLDHPPAFVALRPERGAAANGADYPGAATARLQREGYPAIKPLLLAASRDAVFAAADQVARDMGWRIVAVEAAERRIEAVARTFWFGFHDDIVVRISEAEDGRTQVDMRSASRVGKSDLGTNARRITEFLRRLQTALRA